MQFNIALHSRYGGDEIAYLSHSRGTHKIQLLGTDIFQELFRGN
jgi:hypothetical protein